MSYDLVFWQQPEGYADNPKSTYHRLLEGETVDGLNEIGVGEVLDAIQTHFADTVRDANGDGEWIHCERPDGSAFEVSWSPQHVLVTCRRSSNEDMNAFVDIAFARGCPLYDPQVNQRFA